MDTETTDLVRLLRRFGVRALALAAVTALVGYPTVAMVLGLVGCGLLFARPRGRLTTTDEPATPGPPGSSAPDRAPQDGSHD